MFSNPDVVKGFVPVALKAGLVNYPPDEPEGRLYRRLNDTKLAPQGICVLDSTGRPLAWALMFDDAKSVAGFFERQRKRFEEGATETERYMRYPSEKAESMTAGDAEIGSHKGKCIAAPDFPDGTIYGRVYGRAFRDGKPFGDPTRQEHYVEARFTLIPSRVAGSIPDDVARAWVNDAHLGMLDVAPERDRRAKVRIDFRIRDGRVEGTSEVSAKGDNWSHEIRLAWEGRIDAKSVLLYATGTEKLKWKAPDGALLRQLPAGRPVDLECDVRYGFFGRE